MRIAIALLLLATAGSAVAEARPAHHRHHHARHLVGPGRIGVMHDVLINNRLGDEIIDGTTGFHRSDWGVMVPDSEPQSFVATGRASGSGLGASGLPGRNWQ